MPSQKNQGFTLVEILLSIFLILAILSVLFSTSGTYLYSRSAHLQSIAASIASKQIETLRDMNFSQLSSQNGSFTDPDFSKLPSAQGTRTITDYGGDTNIKQVTIDLKWTENNNQKEIKMETLIALGGL